MRHPSRNLVIVLAILCAFMTGCTSADSGDASAGGLARVFKNSHVTVPAGAQVSVRLTQSISSESAKNGDRWVGTLTSPVSVEGRQVIPAGATVEGVIVAAEEAQRGSRARLELGVRSVEVGDRKESLQASSEAVVAGSTRARNLGAIAASKGYPVVLKTGTVMTFSVSRDEVIDIMALMFPFHPHTGRS